MLKPLAGIKAEPLPKPTPSTPQPTPAPAPSVVATEPAGKTETRGAAPAPGVPEEVGKPDSADSFPPVPYDEVANMRYSEQVQRPEIKALVARIEADPLFEQLKALADKDNQKRIAQGGYNASIPDDAFAIVNVDKASDRFRNLNATEQKKADSLHARILKNQGLRVGEPFAPFANYLIDGGATPQSPTAKRAALKAAQAQEAENLKRAVLKEAGKLYSNPVPSPEILRAGGKWIAYEVAIRSLDAQTAFKNSSEVVRAMADEFGDWVSLHSSAMLVEARDYWTREIVPDFKASKNVVPVWIEGDEVLEPEQPAYKKPVSLTRQEQPVQKTAESLQVSQGDLGGESPLFVTEQEFLKKPRNQDEDEARQTESAAIEALKAPDADKRGVSKTHAYRGVSQDELEAIVKSQEIKSDGRANFESESGTTSFTDNPITANNYATTFRTQSSKRGNPDGAFYILRVKQDESMVRDAEDGYLKTSNAIPFSGVDKIIEDLKWAIENDVWNISRTNSINNGVISIKTCKVDERKEDNN